MCLLIYDVCQMNSQDKAFVSNLSLYTLLCCYAARGITETGKNTMTWVVCGRFVNGPLCKSGLSNASYTLVLNTAAIGHCKIHVTSLASVCLLDCPIGTMSAGWQYLCASCTGALVHLAAEQFISSYFRFKKLPRAVCMAGGQCFSFLTHSRFENRWSNSLAISHCVSALSICLGDSE